MSPATPTTQTPDDEPGGRAAAPAEGPTAPRTGDGPDDALRPRERGRALARDGRRLVRGCLGVLVVCAAVWAVGFVLHPLFSAVIPVGIALLLGAALTPTVNRLVRQRVPRGLAAGSTLLGVVFIMTIVGLAVIPPVVDELPGLGHQAASGVHDLQEMLRRSRWSAARGGLDPLLDKALKWLETHSETLATTVLTGVTGMLGATVTGLLTAVLTFLVLKDGPRFLPFLRRALGDPAGPHAEALGERVWSTLGGYVRTQAMVSGTEAVVCGIGLWALGVPLWPALMVVMFVGGFLPIIGAFITGGLATLVALVAGGPWVALGALGIFLGIHVLEGNVLVPWWQGKTMRLHAAVVLVAVLVGGSTWGIAGAFLAVPVAAAIAESLRYYNDVLESRDEASAQPDPEAGPSLTDRVR